MTIRGGCLEWRRQWKQTTQRLSKQNKQQTRIQQDQEETSGAVRMSPVSIEKNGEKIIVTTEEAELKKKGYTLGGTLGEGSYAKVKSAFRDKENKRVAVKIINQKKAPKDFKERFLPRELDILQSIHHENLVNLFEIFCMNGKVSCNQIYWPH